MKATRRRPRLSSRSDLGFIRYQSRVTISILYFEPISALSDNPKAKSERGSIHCTAQVASDSSRLHKLGDKLGNWWYREEICSILGSRFGNLFNVDIHCNCRDSNQTNSLNDFRSRMSFLPSSFCVWGKQWISFRRVARRGWRLSRECRVNLSIPFTFRGDLRGQG